MSRLAHGLRSAAGNAGGDEVNVAYTSFSTLSDVTSATKTFTSVDIGTPNADRYVIVALQWVNTSSTPSISSATINGVSASVATSRSVFYNTAHGVFFAKVPTGTSVTIVANLSDTTLATYNENIAVYTINTPTLGLVRDLSLYSTSTNSVAFTGASRFDDVTTNEFLISNVTLNGVRDDISVDELSEDTYQTSATGTNFYASYNNNTESLQDIAPTFSWGGSALNVTATIYRFSYAPLDYEADFGTPDYTITSFPSTGTGVDNGTSNDALIAIDANISSTDDGVLMEAGATGTGLAIGVSNETLRVRGYTGNTAWGSIDDTLTAYLEIDISDYTGTFCTYYFAFDTSASRQLKAYVQVGGKGSAYELILLGTDFATSATGSIYGVNTKGYGQVGSVITNIGTDYEVNFTGTINEIRYWAEDAALDVSTFGTL